MPPPVDIRRDRYRDWTFDSRRFASHKDWWLARYADACVQGCGPLKALMVRVRVWAQAHRLYEAMFHRNPCHVAEDIMIIKTRRR